MSSLKHKSKQRLILVFITFFLVLTYNFTQNNHITSVHAQGAIDNQYKTLLSDSLFLYSPSVLDFDVQAFLETLPGPLKEYKEVVNGQEQTAAEIISYNSIFYGINPQFILLILESQENLLTSSEAQVPKRIGVNEIESSFFHYVNFIANETLTAYEGRRYHQSDDRVVFSDGRSIAVPMELNAGTYATQVALAKMLPQSEWEIWVTGDEPIFIQKFSNWFSNPFDDKDKGLSTTSTPNGYILPFSVEETWYYTGGPHHYTGVNRRPWSSIDLAPLETISCPYGSYPTNRWIVAAKSGNVIQSSQGLVVIDHGDGYRTYYSHVSGADRRGLGGINQNDSLGHPSCEVEPGGLTTGVHVHFAIFKIGTGFIDINGLSFSGWIIQETTHYNGIMSNNGVIRTATVGRYRGTNDIFNSGTDGGISEPKVEFWSQPDWSGKVVFSKGKGSYENLSINAFSLKIPSSWSTETWKANNEYRCWSASEHKLHDYGWENGITKVVIHDRNACPQVKLYPDIEFRGPPKGFEPDKTYEGINEVFYSMLIPTNWSVETWRKNETTPHCWNESVQNLKGYGWHDRAIWKIEVHRSDVCTKPIRINFTTDLTKPTPVEIVVAGKDNYENRRSLDIKTTNAQGDYSEAFTLPPRIDPDVAYDIFAKPSGYLRKKIDNYILREGINTLEFGTFRQGDVNDDNYINVGDLIFLLAQWGPGPSKADLNDDGLVNVGDLLIVLGNWGNGEGWPESEFIAAASTSEQGGTDDVITLNSSGKVLLTPDAANRNVGDIFDVAIQLNSGSFTVSGADIRILYDPAVLEVLDADSDRFGSQVAVGDLEFEYHVNDANSYTGEIRVSVSGATFQGVTTLGTIKFKAISSIDNTAVQVLFKPGSIIDSNLFDSVTGDDILGSADAHNFMVTGSPSRPMPIVSLTPGSNTIFNSSLIELEANAEEPHNQIREVKFEAEVDGDWVEIATDTNKVNGWRVDWDTSILPDGVYRVRTTALLLGGQGTTATNDNLLIDRTPPTYAFSGFDPFVASPGTPVTIDVIAVDEGSGINSIDVYVNSAADGSTNGEWHLIGSISGQQGNLVWDTTGYAEGIYRVAFDMYDNAGNQGPDPQPILFYEIRENNEEVLDNSVFLPLVVKEN